MLQIRDTHTHMDMQSVGVHPLYLGSFFHYLLKAIYKLGVLEMRCHLFYVFCYPFLILMFLCHALAQQSSGIRGRVHICAKIGTHTHIHIWDSGADGGAEGRVQDQL